MKTLVKRILGLTLTTLFVISVSFEYPAQNHSRSRPRTVSSSNTPSKEQNSTSGSSQNNQQNQSSGTSALPANSFGLGSNNLNNSPFDEWRVYWKENGKTRMKVVREDYKPKPGELKKQHHAYDFTSRDEKGNKVPINYITPIGGRVVVEGGRYNAVKVVTPSGGEIRFLHSSKIHVKTGDQVPAGALIGQTGDKGAPGAIHLHVETRNPQGVYTKVKPNMDESPKRMEARIVEDRELLERERVVGPNVKSIEDSLVAKGSLKPKGNPTKNREETMRKIEESMIAKGSLKPKSGNFAPGGILFDKEAEMLSDLSDVYGAFYDPQAGRIVFIGERILDAPQMDRNLLAAALRAVYSGAFPGVSIDPSSDPSVMKVRYEGQTENTRFGAIMFEADRILKALSRGEDNLTKETVISSVAGFKSIFDRQKSDLNRTVGSSLYRLWFKPDKLALKKTTDGRSVAFTESTMVCDWEKMQGVDPGPTVQAFVNHLNNNLQQIADEQPIFQEMLFLEKVVGLALWMREQNLFLDPNLLGIEPFETPTTTPATNITSSVNVGDSIWTLMSTGGVDFSITNSYIPDTDKQAAQLKEAALRSRPRLDMVNWDFELNGNYLTAVSLPITRKNFSSVIVKRIIRWKVTGPIITDFSANQASSGINISLFGQNFGVRRPASRVILDDRPIGVLSWGDQKVVAKIPENSDGGRLVIVAGGLKSNPLDLRVVSRPAVATVRVVNEIEDRLYLKVADKNLSVLPDESQIFTLKPGTYPFEASAGGVSRTGIQEFQAGSQDWTFDREQLPKPVASISVVNETDDILYLRIAKKQLSIQAGSSDVVVLPPGKYYFTASVGGSRESGIKEWEAGEHTWTFSRPVTPMASIQVVNQTGAMLYLTVGGKRLRVPDSESEVLILPAGRYNFTASAGGTRDSGVKEWEAGNHTWEFTRTQLEEVPAATGELSVVNDSNVTLTVVASGTRTFRFTVPPGERTFSLPAGSYSIRAHARGVASEGQQYFIEPGSRIVVSYRFTVRYR